MRWFRTRGQTPPVGLRKNQRRDTRTKQAAGQRSEAGRTGTAARWTTVRRRGGLMAGVALLGSAIVTGAQDPGPALQRLLEIKTVTVDGLHRIQKQDVIDLMGLKPGVPLHHIVTAAIKEQVESHPWVKEAVVSRILLHELRVSVVERKPAAVIRTGAENFLSDESGHLLARLGQVDDDALPMVTGIDPRGLIRGDEQVRQAIVSGIELAKLVGHTYDGRLQVNAENPSSLVASVRGVQFQFGEEAVSEQWERFQRVRPTLRTLNFDGQGNGANEVDLRYENRIIVRGGG
ncbi:MAG: cell division protein FtsQ/DivIB [Nitrospiraceae bacterium]